MRLLSHLSIIRGIGYLLVFILCVNCKKDHSSTDPSQLSPEFISQPDGGNLAALASIMSQTRTASRFNYNLGGYLNLWSQLGAQYVSTDDNSYAYSKKLSPQRDFLLLLLQDFHFDIPPGATIENIIVSARRFKTGNGSVKDYFATLNRPHPVSGYSVDYGVRFVNPDHYPSTETAVIYSQSGTGNNGGFDGKQYYQWTSALINDPAFGVRIDVAKTVNRSVTVYYDLVEITVEYSIPPDVGD
ncbi:MAG TPA: hypothetical protein VJ765_17415 [Chitinophagaceae bacterium]|nr:hypothetical protein [Chitinophagaceae bacterium]